MSNIRCTLIDKYFDMPTQCFSIIFVHCVAHSRNIIDDKSPTSVVSTDNFTFGNRDGAKMFDLEEASTI